MLVSTSLLEIKKGGALSNRSIGVNGVGVSVDRSLTSRTVHSEIVYLENSYFIPQISKSNQYVNLFA